MVMELKYRRKRKGTGEQRGEKRDTAMRKRDGERVWVTRD